MVCSSKILSNIMWGIIFWLLGICKVNFIPCAYTLIFSFVQDKNVESPLPGVEPPHAQNGPHFAHDPLLTIIRIIIVELWCHTIQKSVEYNNYIKYNDIRQDASGDNFG